MSEITVEYRIIPNMRKELRQIACLTVDIAVGPEASKAGALRQ